MKLVITHINLQRIAEDAMTRFRDSHNPTVDAKLFPALCIIEAFADFAQKEGVLLELQSPQERFYEPIDD